MVTIQELTAKEQFRGSKYHRTADLSTVNSNISIDHSGGSHANNVYTSVDCYVAGSYTTRDGKSMDITQRYTIYVAYNKDTQKLAMDGVRQRIIEDFKSNFPQFDITKIFIPENKFIVPKGNESLYQPAEFYQGSEMFKDLSRIDVARYKMHTEKDIYKSKITDIKNRYRI